MCFKLWQLFPIVKERKTIQDVVCVTVTLEVYVPVKCKPLQFKTLLNFILLGESYAKQFSIIFFSPKKPKSPNLNIERIASSNLAPKIHGQQRHRCLLSRLQATRRVGRRPDFVQRDLSRAIIKLVTVMTSRARNIKGGMPRRFFGGPLGLWIKFKF